MNSSRPLPLWGASALLLACLSISAPASADEQASVRAIIVAETRAQFRELIESSFDIPHVHGLEFDVRLTPGELDDLRARGFRARVVSENLYEADGQRSAGGFLPEYMSFSEMVTDMNDLVTNYPGLTELTSIGTSLEGRSQWALKVSDNASVDEDEPEVLIMGCHHAREVISVMVPMAVATDLLTNYGTDPQKTSWVDEREIWFVPCVNPDGFVYVENSNLFWRKNRRNNGNGTFGVDPNRNYGFEWGHDNNGSSTSGASEVYRGTGPASEPEVANMQAFMDSREFKVALSYHSFGNLLLWGPGFKPALGPDEDIHSAFGALVAAENGYRPGNPASGAIYITNGDTDDWAYFSPTHDKIFAFTPEVGTSSDYFNPPASRIPTLISEGSVCAYKALEYADRMERLAPPGPVSFIAAATGSNTVAWNGPQVGDTQAIFYELIEQTGPGTTTDDFESGTGNFDAGDWSISTARSFSGSSSLYSGSGNELNRIVLAQDGYIVQPGDEFSFRAWYSIESNWDYAYAILSTDGGRTFTNLAGTGTTQFDPNGTNADNGITGSSGGWQLHTYDLAAYEGQTVWLGFRYYTDGGFIDEGIYVDDVHPIQTWTTTTIVSSTIPDQSYTFPIERAAGTYYYTVRGQDAEGDWGYPSPYLRDDVADPTDVNVTSSGAFSLSANSPNPFSGRTTIRFALPAQSSHSLVVYDVTGRSVRTLSEGTLARGAHEVVWDGRNDRGRIVPSGVYFYALKSDAGELRKRATLRR